MKVPAVGESITEVTVASWKKNDGDRVEMDEIICELESDKATFEVAAEVAGKLTIKALEGETLEVGAVLCEIDEDASQVGELSSSVRDEDSGPLEKPSDAETIREVYEMKVPAVGESITEVTLASWQKSEGDLVELDEVIAEIESDKATFDISAESRGILRIVAQEGDTLKIGALICKIEVMEGNDLSPSSDVGALSSSPPPPNASWGATYAVGHPSPAAAKLMAEKGLTSDDIKGTGRGGRITKEDALRARKSDTSFQAEKPALPLAASVIAGVGDRIQRREKMTSLRRTISRRLVAVKNETAMLTTFNEVNMAPIMEIRKKHKESFKEKYEVGLGFMSFFVKASCMALQEWPAINGQIDGDELVYSDYCDVSIAVSTPKGLVVPVIRNAESLRFDQIEKEVVRLATKARDGKLSIEEMEGGTFTLTNGGVFGSMMSTPIINAPQSAILGMHNIVERPVVENGSIVARPMMYVALSYDHRIIDGRESVSFLVRVKQLLEDPSRLLLGV